jgi:hypothetical protein
MVGDRRPSPDESGIVKNSNDTDLRLFDGNNDGVRGKSSANNFTDYLNSSYKEVVALNKLRKMIFNPENTIHKCRKKTLIKELKKRKAVATC